jgi:excisionase family DNA binding protein
MSGTPARKPNAGSAIPLSERHSVGVAEAAQLTGLSRTRLYQLLKSGEVRSLKVGSQRLILASSLTAYLEARLEQTPLDDIALNHARRLLKALVPDGALVDGKFVLADTDQSDNPGALLSLNLTTGAWIVQRANGDPPLRGHGLVSFIARACGLPQLEAANLISSQLHINPKSAEGRHGT